MKKYIVLLTVLLSLSGCIAPVLLGGAAVGSAVIAAKDRTGGETVDDIKISASIKKAFLSKGFKGLYAKIDCQVMEGRVLYTGTVASDEDVITAVDIAWSQSGVKEVVNELQISDNSNYFDTAEYARDTWITSRIKTKTMLERDIKFVNYTIITSKGVVFVFGIARSEAELDKVLNIAAEVKGVQKVVNHTQLKG
jgi:osmotically-inducible protein OsmY